MEVLTIETPQLGDRTYVASDGQVALVVDPQRDLARVDAVLARAGLRVGAVAETHVHNDYVTGGHALAVRESVRYLVPAGEDVAFERTAVQDGDVVEVGGLTVRVVATPGHTEHHVAYVVSDSGETAVFSGGGLLYGSVGRTDLVDPARTEELTRAQHRSARRLVAAAPGAARLYPTHGFGSFCSAGPVSGAGTSTLAAEQAHNHALTIEDEDVFVADLLAGLTAYPGYYAHMAPLNRAGPGEPDLSPPVPMDPSALRRHLVAGNWAIDLRSRVAYAAGHVAGTISIELGQQFATYAGWLVPWGAPLALVGDSMEQVAAAQLDLARIGVDHLAGAAVSDPQSLAGDGALATTERRRWENLHEALRDDPSTVVLDVRRDDERQRAGLVGAVGIPLHTLLTRLDDVPPGRVWVHCGSGYRAAIAASLLARAGRDAVHVDDDWSRAASVGLPIARTTAVAGG